MPTLKDVARKANVSLATASYALNNDRRIKKETREKVLKAAKELKYVANASARSLRTSKYNRILVFVSNFGGPVHQITLEYLYQKLLEKNYEMIVCNGKSAKTMLRERSYDGVINLDGSIDNETLLQASFYNYPMIDTTRNWKNDDIISLPLRGTKPVYEAITLAINENIKSFGYVHGSIDSYDDKHRFNGFLKALNENNIKPELVLQGNFTSESGYDVIKDYLKKHEKLPEFIFFANDEMAIGAIDYLKKVNYDLKSIKILGFDNISLSQYYIPSLSTIAIDRDYWTSCIVDSLINMINTEQIKKYDCKYTILRRQTF